MVEGGTLSTSYTANVNTVDTKVNTAKTKVNTTKTKVNTGKTKVNTAGTKVKLIPKLLILPLLLLTIFRATAATSYLKFSDQTKEPIDQAGTKSILSLSSEFIQPTLQFAGYQLCKLG